MLKFIYSEKPTKFYEISTVDLSYVVLVKSTVEISQNSVAFSEYMNFTGQQSASKLLLLKKLESQNNRSAFLRLSLL